jgi:hypothetical protein
MFDIQRHKATCMILISAVLFVWQFYLVKQSYIIDNTLSVAEKFPTEAQTHLNSTEIKGKKANTNEMVGSIANPIALKTYQERYELMANYEQERLSDVAPTFKRILFWNEVREFNF